MITLVSSERPVVCECLNRLLPEAASDDRARSGGRAFDVELVVAAFHSVDDSFAIALVNSARCASNGKWATPERSYFGKAASTLA